MDLEPPSRTLTCVVRGSSVVMPIWEKGDGRLLVMLHGWGLDHQSFGELRNQLAPSFRVVTLDLPGFGQAALPAQIPSDADLHRTPSCQAWGVSEYAELVEELLRQLDPQGSVILLGHSFGGRIGMRLATTQPGRISELILVASAGLRRPAPFMKRLQLKVLRTLGRVAQLVLPGCVAEPLRQALVRRMASSDYLNAGPLRSTLVKVVNEDASAYATSIQAPTLLLWGGDDRDTPPWIGEALRRLIPRASLCILPDLDHHSILSAGRFQVAYQIRKYLENQRLDVGPTWNTFNPRQDQDLRTTFCP